MQQPSIENSIPTSSVTSLPRDSLGCPGGPWSHRQPHPLHLPPLRHRRWCRLRWQWPLVSKVLEEELTATFSDGAAREASMVLVMGGGLDGNPGHPTVASAPDSSAVGGGMLWL
jgi:hypothetical protein